MTKSDFQTRVENKYIVKNADFIQSILQAHFRPDPEFPFGQVNTLHFDTIDLDGIQDKRNGEIYKNKLRLRWYGSEPASKLPQKAFLENKMAIRKMKKKRRTEIALTEPQRIDPFIARNWLDMIETHSLKLKFLYQKPLFPIMISKYQRRRFYDPCTGVRLALDRGIQVTCNSPDIEALSQCVDTRLNYSVLEIKGMTDQLPLVLRGLKFLQLAAISKYEQLFNCALQISR